MLGVQLHLGNQLGTSLFAVSERGSWHQALESLVEVLVRPSEWKASLADLDRLEHT